MSLDAMTLLTIIAMALATGFTRLSGPLFMRFITVEGRLKAALDALPPAILMAVIAPTVLTTGWAEAGAGLVTAAAAALRLPLLVVLVTGVVSVVLLRQLIG